MKKNIICIICTLVLINTMAQNALVNTTSSKYAKLRGVGMSEVQLTTGFWAERFATCRNAMLPQLWATYTSKTMCYSFQNFRIAAGLDTGQFRGPSFHDGDFYKVLEAMAAVYAVTKDAKLNDEMDMAIAVIGKAQKPDGYIYTKSIIDQQKSGQAKMFDDKLSFEAYNFGHLMTAACAHYRATGKTSLLNIAKKATDFLIGFYDKATPEQARNAICPSHYMGITEMYRTTGEKKYLQLITTLMNIRGTVEGTDDNSDRQPFRQMEKVVGHAVRANYLFAGAADLYAETGEPALLTTLDKMWDNVVNHKMYVTGGCGALYDGVSVDGVSYKPDTVQKVHQAYGRDYQLPNFSAHNETCANIGNVLWNWRMLLVTGQARYADVMELALYNSVLSGVSMQGTEFFYTNPLAASADYPYQLRWQGGRQPYIQLSNCCPPNLVRTIAEVGNYMYGVSDNDLYVHLYSANKLRTQLPDGSWMALEQQTLYPWNGAVTCGITEAPAKKMNIHFRMPGWCKKATVSINGKIIPAAPGNDGYIVLNKQWKAGDKIQLVLDMPAVLLESNPLVEETRNQVTVKRGPVVYCLESADLPASNVFNIGIPAAIEWRTLPMKVSNGEVLALTGKARLLQPAAWKNTLYRQVDKATQPVEIKLIPYFAWANRGKTDMTVWMPLLR